MLGETGYLTVRYGEFWVTIRREINMRRVVLGAMIAGAIAGPSLAADLPAPMPMPAKAPAVVVPAFSWTGSYAGLNIGYAWTTTDFGPATALNIAPNTLVGYP